MIGNFLKNYIKVNKERMDAGIVDIAAALDAEGVSEAAIKQKMDQHDALVKQLVIAKNMLEKEKREYDSARRIQDKRIEAIRKAKSDYDKDPNDKNAKRAVEELLDAIEKHSIILEKEKKEFEEAEFFVKEIETVSLEIADQLKQLRSKVNEVKAEIKKAEIESNRMKQRSEQAEILAGLKTSSNKFDVAMNALQNQADKHKQTTEMYKIKSEQLSPTLLSASDKYMKEDEPSKSLEDRFNNLGI